MKMSKVLTTVLTATAALVLLSACSSDKKTDSSSICFRNQALII